MPRASSHFYNSPHWEGIYRRKILLYREFLEEIFPDKFDWRVDAQQVVEMCRLEIELERYDAKIANDAESYVWMDRLRKGLRDTLAKHRRSLGLSVEMRIRLLGTTTVKGSAEEDFVEAFA